ncbi:hypothetical protein EYZ11_001581 [Aspergillus tanneri]|uniref:Zn(2)-C6 fungal-type domain-containing protein n=1 Tax=Aspergillus tanneri TaxID=1220188 RepID=A0A4V6RQY4_9EURO|nr:hypothetical protein EYZ11_001581 [Aspergillus tanneri]
MADIFDEQAEHSLPQSSAYSHQAPTSHKVAPPATGQSDADGLYVPRPKRIACVVCRRRKLRCDGKKPSCGTCARLGHECAYDEVRKKSGPKRGYVKQLEARLGAPISPPEGTGNHPIPGQTYLPSPIREDRNFGWDMISLGLEEPLPAREAIDELHMAAMDLAPSARPPVCLQYITWSHAASMSDKYHNLHELFYQRARKYAELDEMKGLGEGILSLSICQTWLLIGTYEFRMMCFPRAWVSVGKASRLALMLGLNRLDGMGLGVKQSLPPTNDWTENEERRRVFWMAFCVDRYASVGTGWPVLIDDRDVMTNLPASEEAFINGQPQQTARVTDIASGDDISTLSAFGSVVFMAYLFGRNLTHLHRPDPQDNEQDLNGLFWQRHRSHDNILLHFALTMPNHLRLPAGVRDPNVIFCNMAIHTSTICLHQAAIFKAEKNKISEQITTESKRRCIVAADQITNIMKMISHIDLTIMNPFMAFCVYIAARVFVQYLKSRPDDSAARSSLQFLFSALGALKKKNPLTESFLVQLDVDMEGTSVDDIRPRPSKKVRTTQGHTTAMGEEPDTQPLTAFCPSRRITYAYEEESPSSSSNSSRPPYRPPTSLPSRQKQPPTTTLPMHSAFVPCTITPQSFVPQSTTTAPDMDLSPEFTDGSTNSTRTSTNNSNPLPDEPVPLNPTTTTTTQPQSRHPQLSSAQNGSQHPTNLLEPNTSMRPSLEDMVPGSYANYTYSGRGFPQNGIMTPLDSNGSEGSIHIPPTWDFAPAQDPNAEHIDMAAGGVDSFNEAQWAQLLSSSNWDAWRNQG